MLEELVEAWRTNNRINCETKGARRARLAVRQVQQYATFGLVTPENICYNAFSRRSTASSSVSRAAVSCAIIEAARARPSREEAAVMNRSLWVLSLPLILLLPATVHADASITRDSCVAVGDGNYRVYFTVYNAGLPRSICSLQLIPVQQPPTPECTAIDCGPAAGWSCALTGSGGAWYGALPSDPPYLWCIGPWESRGGFYITIDPGFCCYNVQYVDQYDAVIMQEKECFTSCGPVPTEHRSWGAIKQLYRE